MHIESNPFQVNDMMLLLRLTSLLEIISFVLQLVVANVMDRMSNSLLELLRVQLCNMLVQAELRPLVLLSHYHQAAPRRLILFHSWRRLFQHLLVS
jgi:hypothetical protein